MVHINSKFEKRQFLLLRTNEVSMYRAVTTDDTTCHSQRNVKKVIMSIYTTENPSSYVITDQFCLYSSYRIDDVTILDDSALLFRVSYTGQVDWSPSGDFTVYCSTDVTYYPFDTQECYLST